MELEMYDIIMVYNTIHIKSTNSNQELRTAWINDYSGYVYLYCIAMFLFIYYFLESFIAQPQNAEEFDLHFLYDYQPQLTSVNFFIL